MLCRTLCCCYYYGTVIRESEVGVDKEPKEEGGDKFGSKLGRTRTRPARRDGWAV